MICAENQTMILNPTCLNINFLNTLRSRLASAGHNIESSVAGQCNTDFSLCTIISFLVVFGF